MVYGNTKSGRPLLGYGGKVLLMERGLHKKLAPGMWFGIGGFIEPHEINSPISACYREIEEETGIEAENIDNLELRYMTIQYSDGAIEIMYYFIGALNHLYDLIDTDEGKLHWVDENDALDLPMSVPVKTIMKQWLSTPDETGIMLCVIDSDNNAEWSKLS